MCNCPEPLDCEICGSHALVEVYQDVRVCDRCLVVFGERKQNQRR